MISRKPKIQEGDFYKVINQAIAEERHVDYLQEVLKKYEEYKRVFDENFTDKNPREAVYKFHAVYLLKKPVWRDIEILGKQTFCHLAEEIIYSMNWDNDHMHGFEFPKVRKKPAPFFIGSAISFFAPGWEDDPHPTYKSDEIRICDMDYTKQPKLKFMFDFGDGHEFDIAFGGTRSINKKEKERDFPRMVDQRGVAPEQYPAYE